MVAHLFENPSALKTLCMSKEALPLTFPEALKSEEEKLGLPSGVSQLRVPARGQWGRTEQREEGGTHPSRRGRAPCRSDPSRTPRQGEKARGGLPGSSALGSGGAKENGGSPGRVGAHATLTMVGGGKAGTDREATAGLKSSPAQEAEAKPHRRTGCRAGTDRPPGPGSRCATLRG